MQSLMEKDRMRISDKYEEITQQLLTKEDGITGGHRVDMINILNSQYLGKMFFGSPAYQEEATVVFDTGSNWLTVTSDLCSSCTSQKYNTVKQKKYNAATDNEPIEQRYGSADLSGVRYIDTVCLHSQNGGKNLTGSCIDDFDFMAITRASGLNPGIDGILGLGPNYNNGPSYLMAMYEEEVIDEAIVSFSLGYSNGGSKQ